MAVRVPGPSLFGEINLQSVVFREITMDEARVIRSVVLAASLLLTSAPDNLKNLHQSNQTPASSRGAEPRSGSFQAVTYNIAGLPDMISGSNPSRNTRVIGRLLNAYDLVLVQEDFFYHDELLSTSRHPFRSEPHAGNVLIGDGLSQLSVFPFSRLHREAWNDCNGYISAAMDCWASKGFSFSRVSVAPGIEIDVYNLHFDAGDGPQDVAVRRSNINQILARLEVTSKGRAVIVGGDTNLETGEVADEMLLESFRRRGGFRIACRAVKCGNERKDRFLFRSGESVELKVFGWSSPAAFIDDKGHALSDHVPIVVHYQWRVTPRTIAHAD